MMLSHARSRFLLIDAGNSRIKWALVDAHHMRIAQGTFVQPAQPDWSTLPTPDSAWISNVAGNTVAKHVQALIRTHWPHISHHMVTAQPYQCGVTNRYQNPRQLGSDRWAALIGARAAYPDEPLLIALLGTATTLNALHADGTFIGGLITAGPALTMRALNQGTAQLPNISAEEALARCGDSMSMSMSMRVDRPYMPFGLDTPTAISKGCWLAQAALIERIYHHLCLCVNSSVRCVLSGGGAAAVRSWLTIAHTYDEHLVLSGLAQIAVTQRQPIEP